MVGERVLAAAIHAGSEAARIDFRTDYASLEYSAIDVPLPVRTGMLAFMRTFDLSFGLLTSLSPPTMSGSCSSATRSVSTGGWKMLSICPSLRPWPICWSREPRDELPH